MLKCVIDKDRHSLSLIKDDNMMITIQARFHVYVYLATALMDIPFMERYLQSLHKIPAWLGLITVEKSTVREAYHFTLKYK